MTSCEYDVYSHRPEERGTASESLVVFKKNILEKNKGTCHVVLSGFVFIDLFNASALLTCKSNLRLWHGVQLFSYFQSTLYIDSGNNESTPTKGRRLYI